MAQFLEGAGAASDSEAEDEISRVRNVSMNNLFFHLYFECREYICFNFCTALNRAIKVVLPDRYMGKGNAKAQQSSMKLSELGPRITMELYKVENGLAEGDVLYHKFEKKSTAEASALKAKVSAVSFEFFRRFVVWRKLT